MDALGVIIYGETAHMALSLCSTRGQRDMPFYCYDAAAICDYTNLTTPALAYGLISNTSRNLPYRRHCLGFNRPLSVSQSSQLIYS